MLLHLESPGAMQCQRRANSPAEVAQDQEAAPLLHVQAHLEQIHYLGLGGSHMPLLSARS